MRKETFFTLQAMECSWFQGTKELIENKTVGIDDVPQNQNQTSYWYSPIINWTTQPASNCSCQGLLPDYF